MKPLKTLMFYYRKEDLMASCGKLRSLRMEIKALSQRLQYLLLNPPPQRLNIFSRSQTSMFGLIIDNTSSGGCEGVRKAVS